MATVNSYVDAYNAHDSRGIEALLAEDFRHADMLGELGGAREGFVASLERWWDLVPDTRLTVESLGYQNGEAMMRGTVVVEPGGEPIPSLWRGEFDRDNRLKSIRVFRNEKGLSFRQATKA